MKIIDKILSLFKPKCICTKVCDCQDPDGKLNGTNGGVCLVSMECPIHNIDPQPHPECPVHSNKEWK